MPQRTKNLFDPQEAKPYKLSRSRLENFLRCPRCFYLDRRLGIDQPPIPAFTLNSAVDHLFKKEFDHYRKLKQPHPLMVKHGINAIPFSHPELDTWRENFKGVQVFHQPTNLMFTGAIDDLWVASDGQILVVDYKSTSKDGAVTLEGQWQQAYKRQIEIYQWLLRQKGLQVSSIGYFVYANGRKSEPTFGGRLLFDIEILSHEGSSDWVEPKLIEAKECLMNDVLPLSDPECPYCDYRLNSQKYEHE